MHLEPSIGDAFQTISPGKLSVAIIAGGSEATITKSGIGGFASIKALSNNPDPKKASRPFSDEMVCYGELRYT